ncbi:hypothetical protein ES707_12943 [subsurface metagenome]
MNYGLDKIYKGCYIIAIGVLDNGKQTEDDKVPGAN